jgi:hypothetical protein
MENDYVTRHLINDIAYGFDSRLWANIMIKAESHSPTLNHYENVILSTPNDTLVTRDRRNANKKDLIIHDDGQNFGKFQLIPIEPSLWKSNLVYKGSLPFLKRLVCKSKDSSGTSYMKIGFKCASWPDEATEWKSRKRSHGWPSQSTLEKIFETGVRVVASEDQDNNKVEKSVGNCNNLAKYHTNQLKQTNHLSEELIWEFDFCVSEGILCQKEIRQEQKTLYCILEAVTQFAFAEKSLITNHHLKTLLYFTCENCPSEEIRHQPGKCLLYQLDLLKEFLTRKHFPHYFMRGRNLIANAKYDDIAWYIERIEVVVSNLLAVLYCVLDYCTLKNVFDLGNVFNDLSVVCSRNEEGTMPHDYLVPLCVMSLANLIKSRMIKRARTMLDTWHSELVFSYGKQIVSKEDFVNKVLSELPLEQQWLFALYIDCRDGSDYLQFVCRGRACVHLDNLFGDNVTSILLEETSLHYGEINLPTLILGESMVTLAMRLGDILYSEIGSIKAYQSAIHHFLKSNTHDLLLSIESDQRNKREHYIHSKLTHLRNMFENLYNSYHDERCVDMFRDLMESYDELCNFLATEQDFEFISELWAMFGDKLRARDAYMKAVSVRDESHYVSTSL